MCARITVSHFPSSVKTLLLLWLIYSLNFIIYIYVKNRTWQFCFLLMHSLGILQHLPRRIGWTIVFLCRYNFTYIFFFSLQFLSKLLSKFRITSEEWGGHITFLLLVYIFYLCFLSTPPFYIFLVSFVFFWWGGVLLFFVSFYIFVYVWVSFGILLFISLPRKKVIYYKHLLAS